MQADLIPLIAGALILIASLISLRLGLSVAIIEILLGAIAGNLGILQSEAWMAYLASFGGILLTFLAGTEIDVDLMRQKWRESVSIGLASFLAPFIGTFIFTYFFAGWGMSASLLAGTA